MEHRFNHIVYTCKTCGWQASIHEQWGDVKPKKCGGRKCKTSFRKEPDKLEKSKPADRAPKKAVTQSKPKTRKTKDVGKQRAEEKETEAPES